MNRHQKAAQIFIAAALLLMACAAQAAPGDVELWNTDKVAVGLSDDLALKFEQEFRLAEGDLHYEHSDAGLKIDLLKGLSTSLRYRNVVEFDDGETDMEHRPHWNLTTKFKLLGGLSLKNNVRVEYRIREGKDNNVRYRDRATLAYKWGRFGGYVSDEIFVEKGAFIRNRLYFGVDSKVMSGLKIGAFYMRRTQEKDDWAATHMVGLNVAVSTDVYSDSGTSPIAPTPSSSVVGQQDTPEPSTADAESGTPAVGQSKPSTPSEMTGSTNTL